MRGSRSEPRSGSETRVHDGTADLKRPPRLRVDAAADVQIDAYEFQMENPLAL